MLGSVCSTVCQVVRTSRVRCQRFEGALAFICFKRLRPSSAYCSVSASSAHEFRPASSNLGIASSGFGQENYKLGHVKNSTLENTSAACVLRVWLWVRVCGLVFRPFAISFGTLVKGKPTVGMHFLFASHTSCGFRQRAKFVSWRDFDKLHKGIMVFCGQCEAIAKG